MKGHWRFVACGLSILCASPLLSSERGAGGPAFSLAQRLEARTDRGPESSFHEVRFGVFMRDLVKDAGEIWSYPAHIRRRDLLPIFVLAASVAVLIPNDERIYAEVRKSYVRHEWVRDVAPVVSQMGFLGAGGVVGVFLGVGLIGKDRKATETALLAASAAFQSLLVTQVIQGLTGRQVPHYDDGADHWTGPTAFLDRHKNNQAFHYCAFPSGHTATAFCLATVISMQYGRRIWVPIVSYTVAAGVGLSMHVRGEHWLSDVVVGAAIGHVISRMVVNNHRRRHGLQPALAVGPRGVAVGASYDFD